MAKFLRLVNGVPRMYEETSSSITIYDETVTISTGGLTTGTPYPLPNSRSYNSSELEIYLNGQRLEDTLDYNYYGTVPRYNVTFTFDLVEGDILRFRIDRAP